MMKRILSMLLALLMLASVFPASAFAEDTTATTAATTEATTAPACPTCGAYDCTSDHANWCDICKADNCGKEHQACAKCGTLDCTTDHTNWCDICKADNCGKEHQACAKCGTVDCTTDHTNWCDICKADNCGKEHQACAKCGTVDCTTDHTNWCDTCKKDNCGVDHAPKVDPVTSPAPVSADTCPYCQTTLDDNGETVHESSCNTKFSVNASADVGQTAIFTGLSEFALYADSKPDERFDYDLYDGDDSYDFQQAKYDIDNPPLVKIVEAHWEVSGPALWYRVEALDGEILPEGITSDSWILQRYTNMQDPDNTLFFVDTSLLGKTVGFKNATVALYSDIYRDDSKEVTQEDLPVMVVEDIFHDGEKAWYSVDSENWPQEYADYHYVPASAVELVEAPEEPEWDETTPVDLVLSATVGDVTITFEGRMPIRTTLSASAYEIENPSDFGLENTDNVKAAYDIKLLDGDGNETQPEDAVFLAMDASEMGLENADVVEIIHKHGSEVTKSTHVVINGMLVFPVEDFSIFVVNHTTETTGVQITGNTPENPYVITVGETKIFFDSYGGGETASYSATFYSMSTIFNVIGVIDFFYFDGEEYQQVTVEREGNNNYNYSFDILLNGEPIPGLTDLRRNDVPKDIYTKSTTTTTYIGEWQVADESNAITYEITSTQYTGNSQYVAPYITVTAVDAIDEDESDVVLTYKYVYNGNIYQEEMYLRVVAPNTGLYIDDQVPEDGRLVPAGLDPLKAYRATYTWSRSDGRPILEQALNEDGSINISIDHGGLTEDLTSLTYTLTVDLLNGTKLTAQYSVPYTNEILNSSFETPVLGLGENVGGHKYYMNGYPGLYWKTTAPGNTPGQLTEDIEIIQEGTKPGSDYGVSKAADGKQFVELNAENFGALYQDILTTPGATLSWSFSHNGRTTGGSNNTMYVIIAATKDADSVITEADIDGLLDSIPGNATIGSSGNGYRLVHNGGVFYVWKHSADNNSSTWEKISGSYTVPEGQYLTRLFFASETNTGSTTASTLGNLIDAVSAGEYMDYTVRYYKYENNQYNEVATATLWGTDRVYEKISLNKTEGEDLDTFLDQYGLPASILINGRTYPGTVEDLQQGLYLTDYGTKIDGAAADTFKDFDIVLQIYFQIPNITVTKEIVITNWADLTVQQKETLIDKGLTAQFGLYDYDEETQTPGELLLTTNVTIIQESSSGKLTAMASFPINENYYNQYYWIQEISAPVISNYVMETTYEKNLVRVTPDDKTTVEKESVDSVTVTNTYSPRGNLQVKKLVTKAFTDDVELTAEQLSKDFEFKVSISNPKPGAVYTFTKYIQNPNDIMNEAKAANVPLVKTEGNSKDNSNVLTVDQTGHLTFKLKHGEYIIIHNLPSGACTIEETTKDAAYETPVFDKVQYRIPADGETEEAECTNALKRTTGTLKITKNVDNAAGVTGIVPADGFEFTVTLNEYSGDQIPVKFKRATGETTEQIALTPAEDNQKTFKIILKHGETAAIESIPATGYYIQETEYDYFETAWNKNDKGMSLNSGVIRGGATIDAICTNKYGVNTGDLRITKTVKAASTTDTVPDDTYHIRVDLKEIVLDASGTETVGEAISNTLGFQYTVYQPGEDGIRQTISTGTVSTGGSISLKKNQYAVIKGIPSCFYEITETGATSQTVNNYALNEHYDVTYEGKNGRITNGQEAQAKVINTFKRHLAELTITKKGTNPIDENQSYIFNVRCDNPTFGQAVNMNVVITGDNSVTLSELPIGTYTVTEQSGWSWRYTFQSASGGKVTSAENSPTITVTVDGSENNVIEVTNNRTKIYWLNGAAAKPNVFDGTAN